MKNKKRKISAEKENVLSNAEMLLVKRGELLNGFAKNNKISKNEEFFDAPKKIEKSVPEESVFEPIKVSKDKLDSIKIKILRNKKISTTIEKKNTLSDVNSSVNKIDRKRNSEDEAINIYNDIAEKGKNCRNKANTE